MPFLTEIQGNRSGRVIELTGERTVIGRSAACQIVLDSMTVSRAHAQILENEGEYYLEDLGSVHGTSLNGEKIAGRTELMEGDLLGLCNFVLRFHRDNPGSEEPAADFSWLPELLCGQHVNYKGPHLQQLQSQLCSADSPLVRQLEQSFFRVVVLDAIGGQGDRGWFEMERFLKVAWVKLATAFEHYFDEDAFHPEQIAQLLKTEKQSLFCILNVQLLSEDDLHRLRGLGFSQEEHRVLYCGPSHSLGTMAFPLMATVRDEKSSVTLHEIDESFVAIATESSLMSPTNANRRIPVRPEAKLRAVMEISQDLARTLNTEDAFPRILKCLLKIFPDADRGLVVLKDSASGALQAKSVRTRNEVFADSARPSMTIVRAAMDSARAILSDDAAADERYALSDSVDSPKIRSVMCVPLATQAGEVLGAIQIDTVETAATFSGNDLELLAAVAAQSALALKSSRLDAAARMQRDYERDLEFATKVQVGFLPNDRPRLAGYEFFDFYEAANRVGGDFFDYVPLPDGRLAISVGDVAGKGMAAALLMARTYSDARYELLAKPTPAEAMRSLNASVCASGLGHRFITMAIAVLDPRSHTLTVVNAGHVLPLWRTAGDKVQSLGAEVAGLPLGIQPDAEFEQVQVNIEPGGCVLLFTDGVAESMNAANEIYGLPRLTAVVKTTQGGAVMLGEAIIADLEAFCRGEPQRDDICLVCCSRIS